MNFPETFDQAFDWALEDALRHVIDQAAVAAAKCVLDFAKHDLHYARQMGFSSDYIVEAEVDYALAERAYETALYGSHGDTAERVVWTSECLYDGNCNDYRVIVRYMPRAFAYEILKKSDFEISSQGLFKEPNDAVAFAMQLIYEENNIEDAADTAAEVDL